LTAGCSKKDPLEEAAPPPSKNAQQYPQQMPVQKNMPGPATPGNIGGPGMAGPARKPPGM